MAHHDDSAVVSTSPASHADRALSGLATAQNKLIEADQFSYGRRSKADLLDAASRHVQQAQVRALLAIGEELASARADIAGLTDAVRELADAVRTQQPRRHRWFRRTEGGR